MLSGPGKTFFSILINSDGEFLLSYGRAIRIGFPGEVEGYLNFLLLVRGISTKALS